MIAAVFLILIPPKHLKNQGIFFGLFDLFVIKLFCNMVTEALLGFLIGLTSMILFNDFNV